MAETDRSFWHTATGVITAVAALITAIGGVLAMLVQNGVIGGTPDAETRVVSEAIDGSGARQAASDPASMQPQNGSTRIPWESASATMVRRDGTTVTVKAPTVGLACTTETLEFKSGQRLNLDRVRSIDFDAVYLENSSADGVVTLLDGRELTDPIHTWNCPVTGTTELGPLEVQLADIKRIEFHR